MAQGGPDHTQTRPFSCAWLKIQCKRNFLCQILARANAVGLEGNSRLLSFLSLTYASPALVWQVGTLQSVLAAVTGERTPYFQCDRGMVSG